MSTDYSTRTLTFLFSDIEGSTQLWEREPGTMKQALAEHDAILRHAIETQGGWIVKTTGDGAHAAFGTALEAVAAAMAAQQTLQSPLADLPIRVRMGLHTGEAEQRAGDYYGQALNRAARIMSVAHGGQVLLSAVTADLVREHLPAAATLLNLGRHRLKDLARPEQIYQLSGPGLPDAFPPLSSQEATPNNLPMQPTSFVGRETVIAEAGRLLADTGLLSLIGPGGAGKTRLAVQLAGERLPEFRDGIWLVELAALSTEGYVVPTLMSVFGLREAPGVPPLNLVTDYLRARQLLLLLDNCEHLVEMCAELADQFLRACPELKIIATSREALGIPGETVFRVPPLSVPASVVTAESLLASEAGRLFVERATKAEPRFRLSDGNAPAIAQICRRLDGIPLALELAAARVKLFTPEQIAGRLDDRFKLLTGGSRTALPRQQTLRALIDWSYQSLEPVEQTLLCRLSVFAGGWSFEAAEAVGGEMEALDGLVGLVNKSLVNVEEQAGQSRYRFLETIRQYALEKLFQSGQATEARDRHLNYMLDFARQDQAETYFRGAQPERLEQLEIEHDNLRVSLEWALDSQPAAAVQLAAFMGGFWHTRGHYTEARFWCRKVLARTEGMPSLNTGRAELYAIMGWSAGMQGDHRDGREASEEGLILARRSGSTQIIARLLGSIAFSALFLGDYEAATAAAVESEAISRRFGYDSELALVLTTRAQIVFLTSRDLDAVREFLDEGYALARASNFQWAMSLLVYGLARAAGASGDIVTARERFEEAAALGARLGNRLAVYASRSELAHILREHGEIEEPLAIYREVILGWRELGHRAAVAHELECMAFIFRRNGEPGRAVRLLGAAEALRRLIGSTMTELERAEYEGEVDALRARLGESAFADAWGAGRELTMDQAIALALDGGAGI